MIISISYINLKYRPISKILEIYQIQEASFQCASKKNFEYYLSLNVDILTLERKITHWIMDFSSAKMTLLKWRCERHLKLLKSLQSVQEMFIYLMTTLNNLVRKSVKERGI